MREKAIKALARAYIAAGDGSPEWRMARALDALLAILPTEEMAEAIAPQTWNTPIEGLPPCLVPPWGLVDTSIQDMYRCELRTAITAALSTLADKGADHDAG